MVLLTPTAHGFVLVLDRAWESFAEACESLLRLKNSFGDDELVGVDLLAHPPATLGCLLRFASDEHAAEAAPTVLAEAKRGTFRVLDLTQLTEPQRAHFYEGTVPRFALITPNVGDLQHELDRLLEALAMASRDTTSQPTADAVMPIRFANSHQVLSAFGRDLSREGIYVESDALPTLGEELTVALETASGQGPVQLTARVRRIVDDELAAEMGRRPGFYAEFQMRGEETDLFEAFLVAVARGGRWPERSGRRYERFPIRLSAEYVYEGETRVETSGNLSRGGVFLLSARPPALGAEVILRLSAPGQPNEIELHGVVAHVAKADGPGRIDPGAGVRFTDPPALVRARLTQLLGEPSAPKTRHAMVVDDDRFFRTLFKSELERAGYTVLEAANGDDAFGLLLTQLLRLDVLVLDLHMPGMPGADLLKRIDDVGRDPDLAVAVLTGTQPTPSEVRRLLELGADVVVTKAQPPEEILARLGDAIRARRPAD